MVRYSFLVGLFHPRLHAGLSRRLRSLTVAAPFRYRPVTWVTDQTGDVGDTVEADLRNWASALAREECFGSTK
jgi:hypothetical protein